LVQAFSEISVSSSSSTESAPSPSSISSFVSVAGTEGGVPAFLFKPLIGKVVLLVDFRNCSLRCLETAKPSDVEPHRAFEEGDVTVLDVYDVTFLDLIDVVVPQSHIDAACFVSNKCINNSMRRTVTPRDRFPWLTLRNNFHCKVQLPRSWVQTFYFNVRLRSWLFRIGHLWSNSLSTWAEKGA